MKGDFHQTHDQVSISISSFDKISLNGKTRVILTGEVRLQSKYETTYYCNTYPRMYLSNCFIKSRKEQIRNITFNTFCLLDVKICKILKLLFVYICPFVYKIVLK